MAIKTRPPASRPPRSKATPAKDSSTRPKKSRGPVTFKSQWRKFWSWIEGRSSDTSYYLIMGSALALTGIGLMMVLSASSVESISDGAGPLSVFLKQGVFALIGIAAMFVVSRLPINFFKRFAPIAMIAALLALVAVQVVGITVAGNKNWIEMPGGLSLQPSEFTKLILVVFAAAIYAKQAKRLHRTAAAMVPVGLVGVLAIGLVMLGKDLGTTAILAVVLLGSMFFAGVRLKVIAILMVIGAVAFALSALMSGNRTSRIGAWLGTNCDMDQCMQSTNALQGLGTGGLWGVGIGQSRQKWNRIPEAHNDFIFAIIGEELGLLGALVVVALFVVLLVAGVRVLVRQHGVFERTAVGGILTWLVFQAFVNIAMVMGMIPVIGVPLPFVSYGGSALLSSLLAVGVLLAITRQTRDQQRIIGSTGGSSTGGTTGAQATGAKAPTGSKGTTKA